MIRFAAAFACAALPLGACLTAAQAGDEPLAAAGDRTIALWGDNLSAREPDADKLIGLAIQQSGWLTIEGKVGFQRRGDPSEHDSGRAILSISGAPELSRHMRFDWRSEGEIDGLGGYTQHVEGALVWTARANDDYTSKLRLRSDLALDVSGASASVGLGPEWALTLQGGDPLARTRTQLSAGIDIRASSDGAPSATARIELRLTEWP